MEKINLQERTRFSAKFTPNIIRMTQAYKVPLICMNPGQEIPPHPGGAGVFYIVSGSAVMTVDGEEAQVKAGDMIFVDKGQERGVRATDTLTAFAVHIS